MNKIYLVTDPGYDWNEIMGVFSSKEKARSYMCEQYLKSYPRAKKAPEGFKDHLGGLWLEEWIVDVPIPVSVEVG